MATLNKIIVYPIKALVGVELPSVEVTEGGTLKDDRRWAMVDRKGQMQNGKNNKHVFSLRPTFDLDEETISFEDESERFELSCNVLLQDYLSDKLAKPITLKENVREGFPDDPKAYGPTIVSRSSLQAISSWYSGMPLKEVRARFRMNLEIADTPAFWEDQVFRYQLEPKSVQIGDVSINSTNPCARCAVPMKSPKTGEPFPEFYETFLNSREKYKPDWLDARCFDHWYRLGLNTQISYKQHGAKLSLDDSVKII
jgi:uncharacterized protein YcbX